MRLRGKKGLTLVELIVAVAFTAVIIAAACSVLYLGVHVFQSGTSNAFGQQRAALAESYLQRYASTAFDVSSSVEEDADGVIFTVSDDTLTISRQTASSRTAVASVDGISQVEIQAEGGSLSYTIVTSDRGYRLSGGIVLNNAPAAMLENFTISNKNEVLFLEENKAI
jgi:hypothetical protein